ncbi:MAG: ribonuclease J [Chloroflexi bacterium]|nr:ribonuclease J [Chloroflexota bacterium]
MSKNKVKIIPLGGAGEIGKNMLVVECRDDIVVIDAGLKFPNEEMLGIDFIIPDISYLLERKDRVRGIVITHGHEDHIGALPYILPELKVPVYSTRLTNGIIKVKLKERGLLHDTDLHCVEPGDVLSFGSIEVVFFRVNHSIPDAVGLIMNTPAGLIVHTGDFKFDKTPIEAPPTDFDQLVNLGLSNVVALFCDCVRVELHGSTPSERIVGDTFDAVMSDATGRVIITTFASNISRIQQAIYTAHNHGRKVAIIGRSLESNVNVAIDLGFLVVPDDTLISLAQAKNLRNDQVVFITTGSQGEPTSVLSRIATNDHKQIRLVPGDTVIISATPVPGNEETVSRTIDNLFRLGAKVVYDAIMTVHVSGHASRDELKLMLQLVQPQYCIPLHGEYRHMVLFREMAGEAGIAPEQVLLAEVGDILEFNQGSGRIARRVQVGSVLVDGVMVGEVARVVLRDRQHLSRDGVVIVVVALDRQSGELVSGPDIVSRGFVYMREADELIEKAKENVRRAIVSRNGSELEYGFAVQKIKESLGKFIFDKTRRRPMILTVVTEI